MPIDFTIGALGAPVALAGLLVAVLVLAPESLAAVRAALVNDLQRSVNVLLGSALATIGLTIPAVLTFGLLSHKPIVLGLDGVDIALLSLTLGATQNRECDDRQHMPHEQMLMLAGRAEHEHREAGPRTRSGAKGRASKAAGGGNVGVTVVKRQGHRLAKGTAPFN